MPAKMDFRFNAIQACRGVAALFVVLYHLSLTLALDKYFGIHAYEKIFRFGYSGVELFFVLSGFIITYIHWGDIGQPKRLRNYVAKRLVRIYPIYWIVFTAVYVAALALPSLHVVVPKDEYWIVIKSLLLLPQDPLVVGGTGAPVITVAWSLQYEMFFYCLFAAAIASRMAGLAIVGGLVVAYLCRTAGASAFLLSFASSEYILLFGIGVAVAWILRKFESHKASLAFAVLGATSFASCALADCLTQGTIDWRIPYGISSGILIYGVVGAERFSQIRVPRVAVLLGDASYALYLFHFSLISLSLKLIVLLHLPLAIGAMFSMLIVPLICIAFSIAAHLWIERPIQLRLSEMLSIRNKSMNRNDAEVAKG